MQNSMNRVLFQLIGGSSFMRLVSNQTALKGTRFISSASYMGRFHNRRQVTDFEICTLAGKRSICSVESLGLDRYETSRELAESQLGPLRGKFFSQIKSYYIDSEIGNKMIFTNDLFTLLHLAKSDEEIDIAVTVMKSHYKQLQNLATEIKRSIAFGPVLMRMLHQNNKHELAYSLFTDESVSGIFDQISSCGVLMDLLYENEEYDKVIVTWKRLESILQTNEWVPSLPSMLVLGFTLLKQNTKESYEMMVNTLIPYGHKIKRGALPPKQVLASALLAIKQLHPEMAVEILNTFSSKGVGSSNISSNILLLAKLQLGQWEEVPKLLESMVFIFEDVVMQVQEAMAKCEDEAMKHKVEAAMREVELSQTKSLEVLISRGPRRRRRTEWQESIVSRLQAEANQVEDSI